MNNPFLDELLKQQEVLDEVEREDSLRNANLPEGSKKQIDPYLPYEVNPMQNDDRTNAERMSDNMKSPLMVAPEYLGKLGRDAMPVQQADTTSIVPEVFTPPMQEQTQKPQATTNIPTEDDSETPMSAQEKLLAEFKAMQDADRKALEDARSSDRTMKIGGAIGDALATALNARGQMNVKAPGAGVREGAGLGKVADMFQQAPDIASDLKSKREDLLAQYKQLQTGEDRKLQERRVRAYEKQVDASGNAKKELSPYQELMLGEKEKAREQKNVNSMKEVETRRSIIEENIKRAKDLIEKYGTIEITGSQEDQLNGIMNEIATDTAKLQDPDSVARPSEVESVRSTLLPENRSDRLFISNNTAIDTLNKFKDRIDERAKIGYEVRGLTPNQRTENKPAETDTKVHPQTGKTLKKVPGGWEEVD